MSEYGYDAFISYSHQDMKWGQWLQRKLEGFHVPGDVAKDRPGSGRLRIFRDQTDLAGAELQETLNRELERSRYLIVICSPASASSRWVNEEISSFRRGDRRNKVIPFIVSGEPFSDQPELECFPPALRMEEEDEPLGVNIQEIGKNKAFLKVVSVLLDIRFNRLVDREKQRKRKTGLAAGAVTLAVAAVTGALIIRNHTLTRKNKALSFDVYAAAVLSLAQKDTLEPEELLFLQASAEAGNTDAMIIMGYCYKNGIGTEPDPKATFAWFGKAAEAGDADGMVAVAHCYLNGTGTKVNPEQAFYWYTQAARKGYASGMVNLGYCYEDGTGTLPDPETAFDWYRKAAQAGNDEAMYNLARCYRAGIGTEPDLTQAFHWMKELAEMGNRDAMYNMGLMYQYAVGTEEDPRQAYLWYRKAAESEDPGGMRMLGWCLENRYGVENPALEWYIRAAEAGDMEARENLERITAPGEAEDGTEMADSVSETRE